MAREVPEELGVRPAIGRMLVVDWAPHPDEGDKVLFVLSGGQLTSEHIAQIRFGSVETNEFAFCDSELIGELPILRHARRVIAAMTAHVNFETIYLEHGRVMGSG